jgi:outer membrane receptor for monomeric catechols
MVIPPERSFCWRLNRNCDLSLAVSNLEDKKFYNSVLTEGRAWFAQANARF